MDMQPIIPTGDADGRRFVADSDDSSEPGNIEEIYRGALVRLNHAGVPYLVGGAYAFSCLTGITHPTKDLDLFVRRSDCRWLLDVLTDAGWSTEITFPHWLAKAKRDPHLIDVIFSADSAKIFKPSPQVYDRLPSDLNIDKTEIGFVSSNNWDVNGAGSAGFRTFWIQRSGFETPEELGYPHTHRVNAVTDICPLISLGATPKQ